MIHSSEIGWSLDILEKNKNVFYCFGPGSLLRLILSFFTTIVYLQQQMASFFPASVLWSHLFLALLLGSEIENGSWRW